MTVGYSEFIASKFSRREFGGIDANPSGALFPFQRDLTLWALRKGRAAIFADTGLGKTLMQLEWARHVAATGARVLILAPLAVAQQTVREAHKFGIDGARYLRSDDGAPGIVVTNYDIFDHFDPSKFGGVVLDESSILKSFTGATRNAVITAFADTPYRLACTATPAPNDHTELGNHSEFLGVKSRTEMLAEYFVHDAAKTQDWRLKGHARREFWRWVCSWAAIVRKPSDLGYSDDSHKLPPLEMIEHIIEADHRDAHASGNLFLSPAMTLNEQRHVRRSTIDRRVAKVKEIATCSDQVLIWVELNDEGDAIETAIDGAVQVKGSDDREDKEAKLLSFVSGTSRVMVSKPSIFGFGLNLQCCHRMVFVGASHSYEGTYQAIRRCWRFGQARPVEVHVIRSELDDEIMRNYKRKEREAQIMGEQMAMLANEFVRAETGASRQTRTPYNPNHRMEIPKWLTTQQPQA